jgi:hypothetical protein
VSNNMVRGKPIFLSWKPWGAWVVPLTQGQWEEGLAQMRRGLADYETTGGLIFKSWHLALFADACRKAERVEEGLAALMEAFTFVEQTGERVYEAELYRLKGELLLQAQGDREKSKVSSSKTKGRSKKSRET